MCYRTLIECLQEAETALLVHPYKLCPCHNDLLTANILTNDEFYILDWEYAGIGDHFFDLANFTDQNNLSDEHDLLIFWNSLNGKEIPNFIANLKIMSNLREAY